MRLATILAAALLLAWLAPSAVADFGFNAEGSSLLLGADTPFRVTSLADWNNDKYTDLVGVAEDNATFVVYEFVPDNSTFYLALSVPFGPDAIVSTVVADLNRDGLVDAVVHRGSNANPCLVFGDGAVDCDSLKGLWPAAGPVITVADVSGYCGGIDIIISLNNGSLAILNNILSKEKMQNCDYVGGLPTWRRDIRNHFPGNKTAMYLPGTGSGVDINGNCQADFIVSTQDTATPSTNKIVFTAKEIVDDEFEPEKITASWEVPEYLGSPSWMDYDGNGALDVIYPSCETQEYDKVSNRFWCAAFDTLVVVMNQVGGSVCPDNNCCAGHGANFASVTNFSFPGSSPGMAQFTLEEMGCPAGSTLLNSAAYPALFRPLDFNDDRFMDIVTASSSGPLILQRIPGASFQCAQLDKTRSAASYAFRHSIPFFFDLDENGRVDVLTTSTSGEGVWAYRNDIDMGDRYYLTATTLNGVKGPAAPFPPWGAAQVGAVHRFEWQDIDTHLQSATYTQYSNSQAHALQLPHIHFGLAKTFSYVQDYATGMHILSHKSFNTWPVYLIPNSQVVCFGYPITDATKWEIRLFLPTSRFKRLILIALISSLAVIGVPIIYLRVREIQADKKEIMASIH